MLIPEIKTAAEQQKVLDQKLNYRVEIQALVHESNPNYEANRKVIYDLCKNDFTFFADNFLWIPDPESENVDDKDLPFLLYDYQEFAAKEIIKAIEIGYDMPCEKSRKMGISLLVMGIFVWGWNFHKYDFICGSEKAAKVDTRGDMGSLLEKARYMIRSCPDWLVPQLDKKQYDKSMLLIHPIHGAKIKGDANSVDFCRGDRSRAVLLDEFTAWQSTDKQAWASSSATAKCRLPLSTPNYRGKNCYYFQVINNAKKKDLPYLRLHWTLNKIFADGLTYDENEKPTSPWYENEKNRSTSLQEIAAELDIDYESASSGKVFADFDYETNVVENLEYNRNLPLYCSWDFGLDATAILWFQVDNKGLIYVIDEYQNSGTSAEGADIYHYIDIIQSRPYADAIHFGDPHSGNNRNLAARGQSNGSILIRNGIRFKKFDKVPKILERISAGRNMIKNLRVSDKCILFIDCLSSWSMKTQQSGNASSVPAHDIHSHIGDSYSYFCYGYQEKRKQLESKQKKQYKKGISGLAL